MLKFYCLITGDDYNLLKDETPQSKKKVKLFAFCIVIPVLFWAINSFLLSSQVLMKDYFTSILVMIICTVIIFIIEKIIVMSNGSKSIAAFRICIGLIIAAIGSLSMEEVIFKNDIDTQMSKIKSVYVSNALNIKKNELNTDILKKESEVSIKDSIWREAKNAAIGEADGTGGSKIPNRGKITDLKLQKADELKIELDKASSELNQLKLSNESILKTHGENVARGFEMNSLLIRVKALFTLVAEDVFMLIFFLLFTALILLMESVVIIVKLFSKETNYEKKMKLIEEIGDKRMRKIVENNSPGYDSLIFKGDMKSSTELIRRPVNGIFS